MVVMKSSFTSTNLTKYTYDNKKRGGRMIDMLSKLREWHETQIIGFQRSVQLDDYHMYWLAFGKGVILTMILLWII